MTRPRVHHCTDPQDVAPSSVKPTEVQRVSAAEIQASLDSARADGDGSELQALRRFVLAQTRYERARVACLDYRHRTVEQLAEREAAHAELQRASRSVHLRRLGVRR